MSTQQSSITVTSSHQCARPGEPLDAASPAARAATYVALSDPA